MLFSIVQDPNISANELNHDLHLIQKWAHKWKLEFDPDPTKQATQIIFSCKKTIIDYPPVFFNGTTVSKVDHHKHFGPILEPKLTFHIHIYEYLCYSVQNLLQPPQHRPHYYWLKHLASHVTIFRAGHFYKGVLVIIYP